MEQEVLSAVEITNLMYQYRQLWVLAWLLVSSVQYHFVAHDMISDDEVRVKPTPVIDCDVTV